MSNKQRTILQFIVVILMTFLNVNAKETLPQQHVSSLHDDLNEKLIRNNNMSSSSFGEFINFFANYLDDDDKIELEEHYLQKILGKSSSSSMRRQSVTTVTTTYCNTWCQMQESMGWTIVGFLIICISSCLLCYNEGQYVLQLRLIDFCKNKAIVIENRDRPSMEHNEQLVHFIGNVSVGETTLELTPGTALNITAPLPHALIVKRVCMIYQMYEQIHVETEYHNFGASETTTTTYTLKEDWFSQPQEHQLKHFPYQTNFRGIWDKLIPPGKDDPHEISISGAAHVGGFGLSKDLITEKPCAFQSEWIPLPVKFVPEYIESFPELHKNSEGNLTTVGDSPPTNGDVIISYEYVADGFDVSFIVKQVVVAENNSTNNTHNDNDDDNNDPESGVTLFGIDKKEVIDEKCCGMISDDLGVIWMVRRGRHGLEDMIKMAQDDEYVIVWILRVIIWALLVYGWYSIFSIATSLMSIFPFLETLGKAAFFIVAVIVGTVCCCGVTAVAYIRYRPFLALATIAISCGTAVLFPVVTVEPTKYVATMR